MNKQEMDILMSECGLLPITVHRWSQPKNKEGQFLHTDSYIEGDYTALIQYTMQVIQRERNAFKALIQLDAQTYADNGFLSEANAVMGLMSAIQDAEHES